MDAFVSRYGYVAILIWTFFEGETIVVVAGVAALLGHLDLPTVIAVSIAGSVTGDQVWYYVGRHWGRRLLASRPAWQRRAERVFEHLRRHENWLILTFRFWYGLRSVTPFAVGAAHVPRLRFFLLNLAGAIVWAITFACAGYVLGEAGIALADRLGRSMAWILLTIAALLLLLWWRNSVRRRSRSTAGSASVP